MRISKLALVAAAAAAVSSLPGVAEARYQTVPGIAGIPQIGQSAYFTEYWGGLAHSDPGTHAIRMPLDLIFTNESFGNDNTFGSTTVWAGVSGYVSNQISGSNICATNVAVSEDGLSMWYGSAICAGTPWGGSSGYNGVGRNDSVLYVPAFGHAYVFVAVTGTARVGNAIWQTP